MKQPYLQVTYRKGRPFAAYLYLPRQVGEKSHRSVKGEAGIVVDYSVDGRPIGIEITAPSVTTVDVINRALESAGVELLTAQDLSPLGRVA